MAHFIVFHRSFGHCVTHLIQAGSLREALAKYAVKELDCGVQEDGTLIYDNRKYSYPLELIEAEYKRHSRYDELQWDEKQDKLLNGSSWEIHALPTAAWEAETAEVFCSAEPYSIGSYIELCRPVLRKKIPHSRARAFVWYLKDGPLVTFYRGKFDTGPLEIVGRYLIPWQRQHYPKPYTMTEDMVQEWHGSFDDVLDQMHVNFSF